MSKDKEAEEVKKESDRIVKKNEEWLEESEKILKKTGKFLLFNELFHYISNYKLDNNIIDSFETSDLQNESYLDEKIPRVFKEVQKEVRLICYEILKKNIEIDDYSDFFEKYDIKMKSLKEAVSIYEKIEKYYPELCLASQALDNYEFPSGALDILRDKENELLKKKILDIEEEQKNKIKEFGRKNEEIIKLHTRDTLGTMGIFLSIFSVIGLGISSVLNLESNHFAVWSMICGVILITMNGLFYLINLNNDSLNGKIENLLKPMAIPLGIGILLLITGAIIRERFPEKDDGKIVKTSQFNKLEDRLKNIENENIIQNTKINQYEKEQQEKLEILNKKVERNKK